MTMKHGIASADASAKAEAIRVDASAKRTQLAVRQWRLS